MNIKFLRSRFFLMAALCAWSATPTISQANENLREPLSRIAKAVAKVLQERGTDAIAIGEFTGPPSFGSAAGPGIRKILAEEFVKAGIREKKIGANLGIQGKYVVHQDQPQFAGAEKGPPNLRIVASLVDQNGRILTEMNVDVSVKVGEENGQPVTESTKISKGTVTVDSFGGFGDQGGKGAMAETLGATVDLLRKPPNGAPQGTESVIDSFQRPTVTLVNQGTMVKASRESPFGMEILVNGEPRPMKIEDGQPFVELTKNDQFQIRLSNYANYDISAVFLLDGVSSYAFSEIRQTSGPNRGAPKYNKWIVPRQKPFTLKGWHRTNEEVDKFLITDFANSAAAKLGSSGGLGTITTSIRATWREGQEPPPDEPKSYAVAVGVGQGDRDTQRVTEDVHPREFGQTRAVITVRYAKPDAP